MLRPAGGPINRPAFRPIAAPLAALALTLAGCVSAPPRPAPTPPPPPDVSATPEPIPRAEPRSARGNPPFYEVMGKRYFVLASAEGYVERGVASWYGPGFHAASTSSGEPYDMYAMTAAHKTLPLPSYVRVTNLRNGRSVVVRVNDRGPFKDGRVIDLSYTAASKLDMLRDGTTFVEVRAITPGEQVQAAQAGVQRSEGPLYVQAGAFGVQDNAERLLQRLRSNGINEGFVQRHEAGNERLYRVRIGPIANVQAFDRILQQLRSLGVADARLAFD